jgi:hypothetical protein
MMKNAKMRFREFSCENDENTILKQKLKEYENMLISKNKQILSHKNAEECSKPNISYI